MVSWLAGHCRLSSAAAARLVTVGRALEHLPVLAEAHEAGWVSAEQVAEAARVVTPTRRAAAATQGVDLAAIDAALTQVAVDGEHADLVLVVKHYCDALDPDGPEPDPPEGRSLTLSRHADGSLSFRGHLDAVGGEKLQAALEPFVQADRPAGDERTRAQRQGDALVQLADTALAAGNLPTLRTVKPHVAVRVDLDDLADPATGAGAGSMGFGAVISAARARWLACDGAISRVVSGPDGVPLDLGRSRRLVGRQLRRAVELRDGGCVFAGCDAPSHRADVHHLVHWWKDPRHSPARGGPLREGRPPRLPRRTPTRRPLAHLATRRQRDHRPGTPRPDTTRPRRLAPPRPRTGPSPPAVPRGTAGRRAWTTTGARGEGRAAGQAVRCRPWAPRTRSPTRSRR
ncbi:protein of unknown function [Geodermatophilus saharensis]|uniref:DUF222 domain-containing protein n=1 Tax=Geodermatophilus saharensis TaxID=1137994 RepID=A0A239H8R8_9ACTN|nr:DUF222 domain-containing protein [Geodermatophilus saharensis]SNS77438.1 protein of unknown function [Geodermatophilus saharensis]